MVTQKVKYVDYNGLEQTETCHFNLTKAELLDLDAAYPEGLKAAIDTAAKSEDGRVVIGIFKDVIARSYGERSADGKRFVKSKTKTEEFMTSEVYSEFFMNILNEPQSAANFIQGLVSGVSNASSLAPLA